MASPAQGVVASQGGQSNLDQDRDRWFATLQAYKSRYEAERDTIKSKLSHDQRGACRDLDEEIRHVDSMGFPPQARELIRKYQAEIRSRRYTECEENYKIALKDIEKREKEVFQQHHMLFPLPLGLLSRSAANAPPNMTTAASTNRSQTPVMNSQPVQAVPPPPRQPNQPTNISSAPMPSTQVNHHQQWPGYAQAGPHGSPHMPANMYHPNRPGTKPADGTPRTLLSNGRAPLLGNGMPGSVPGPASAPPGSNLAAGSPHLRHNSVDAARGARVPIPPMNQAAQIPRDDRMQLARNGVHPQQNRHEELARQAVEAQQLERQRLLKRKSDLNETSYHDADLKRHRTDTLHVLAPQTIKFQEIYQDGKAEFKHTIVKYEDVFYILRCDEHGVHFKQNALAAAAKHLHGASHGHLKKEHRLAIQKIGFHVVDCTDELAKLNNDVVQKAFDNGYKPLNQLHGPKSGGKRHSGGSSFVHQGSPGLSSSSTQPQVSKLQEPKQQEPAKYITNPEAGELYHARWPKSNKMYVIMVLGWTDLRMCGWNEKFCDLALYKEKERPACYTFNAEGIAGWAEGFGDGQPRVLDREVPVMWFETNGKNRLGWVNVRLLSPFLLDDPDRPDLPTHTSNRARKLYADIRGYDSFEDMLAGVKRQEPAAEAQGSAPTDADAPTQLPSSASDSEFSQDVDMYDFGDNPPKVDDSDDEDYVEGRSRRGKDSDDEMAEVEPATPQPLRRSTQEVRPISRLSDSGWPRSGAAAGTRSSAKKDPTAADNQDVAMDDAPQLTPSKSHASAADKETATSSDAVNQNSKDNVPEVALGTPATPKVTAEGAGKAPLNDSSAPVAASTDSSSSNKSSSVSLAETQPGRVPVETLSVPANSNNGEGERSGASKSPSLEKEMPRVSPKLQVANLLNSSGPENPSQEQPSSAPHLTLASSSKPVDARRPLPSQAAVPQSAPPRHPLPAKPVMSQARPGSSGTQARSPNVPSKPPMPAKPLESDTPKAKSIEAMPSPRLPAGGLNGDASKPSSPTESAASGKDAVTTQSLRSASTESATRRPDPRMSISNALDDQERETAKRTTQNAAQQQQPSTSGQNAATNNGPSSGSSTPRLVSLANDERWRAVRTSESPRIPSSVIRTPLIDRSAAASPVLGVKKEPESVCIDVASFSEGDKKWAQAGKFLRFHIEDDVRGVARTKREDGIEATVDAGRVKAVQLDKATSTVRLMLKTEDGKMLEQRFVFEGNGVTGSFRGARPQATKFYHWVTSKNEAVEHIE